MSRVSGIRWGVDHATGQLLSFIVRYRGRFALGLSCVVLTNAITLAAPWVLKYAVDDLSAGITDAKLIFYGAVILGIAIAGGVTRFATRRVLIGASRAIEYDIRNSFYAHLQRLPLAYFQANRTGDLMSRATNDLNAVRTMVGPAVMYAASTALTFVVALGFMLSINPRLTVLSLIPLPLVTITAAYFGRIIHRRFEQIQEQLSHMSAVTQEALGGVRVVRAYRLEAREIQRFRDANLEYVARNQGLIRMQALFFPSMGLFMGISALLVLWLGARDVMAGGMSVGDLVAFNSYLALLSWPMIAFGWVTNLLQRGRASWRRMLEVLETAPAIDDSGATRADVRAEDLRGAVEFRALSFSYGGATILRDVSLNIPAGRTVAVIGRTGSGKSTLLALLARLHDPAPDSVFVDGIDVRALPLHTLRSVIGMVPQEPFLFSDTIHENVAFGASSDSSAGALVQRDRVREVAAIAQLDKDVAGFPHSYDTRLGERGITLSGGQRQRTAIARALFVDPRILILDDALSSVDTHTEADILRGLREFRRGRTTLIVSHRISTVRDADEIVVLDGGRIAERGTHHELVTLGGLYAELHRRQQLEEELAAS